MTTRWVGIDEAGYGPNLGPLVMTAVAAEGPEDRVPDLWSDLAATVDRAGGDRDRLWIDDSKRIYQAGKGLDRLEAASLAVLSATGVPIPTNLSGLLEALGAGSLADAELSLWLDDRFDPPVPSLEAAAMVARTLSRRPLEGSSWRIRSVRSVVLGPLRFNRDLAASGNKSGAHFGAFARLLRGFWDDSAEVSTTWVRSDKHGGRHFYLDLLYQVFPDAWIDRGNEGPDLSRYTIRDASRRLDLSLQPRADANDGLVALASIVSKHLRERWMEVFNAHWTARLPNLRPTAGYPSDAARFREAIEPLCRRRGLQLTQWWRLK